MVDEEELLTSTWEMRGITFGTMLLIGLLLGKGVSEVSGPGEALAGVAAFGFAYYLSGDPGCWDGFRMVKRRSAYFLVGKMEMPCLQICAHVDF